MNPVCGEQPPILYPCSSRRISLELHVVTSKVSQARPPNLVKELNKNDGFSLSYRQLDCSGYSTIYRQLSPSSFGLVKGTTCFTHIYFYYLSCVAILSLTSAGYSTSTRNAVCIQPTVKQEVCGYCFISFYNF